MAGAKVALNAAAPGANEGEIENAADDGAGDGYEAADPFFGGFLAEFQGQAFGDARGEFFEHLFFGEFLAEVDAGGGGRGEPEFAALVGTGSGKSIKQTKTLDETQRDDGEQAGVGNDGEHAAQAEACAFGERDALGVANHDFGDGVEAFDRNQVHVAKIGDVKAMFAREVGAEVLGIDLDGPQSAEEAKAQKARDGGADGRAFW